MDSNLVKAVTALSPRKVDLAVDNVGGALLPQVVALLGYCGRISVVGRSGGTVPKFNTATLFFRRNRIGGVSVGDFTPQEAHAAWEHIVGRLDAMGQRTQVDTIVPFEEVKRGFDRLAQGPMGKVLVQVAD